MQKKRLFFKGWYKESTGKLDTGPDSSKGRASASGAGGLKFKIRPRHTKGVKNGTSGYLAACFELHIIRQAHAFFFFLSLQSQSISDHHLRCGGWLNFSLTHG